MNKTIRLLTGEDYALYEAMDTGIEEDYIIDIFTELTIGDHNHLYGLFVDDQLAAIAGFTLFVNHYAMLGRLRSERRFRGMSLATDLVAYVRDAAFQVPGIEWVGAITEQKNKPAQRVLEKSDFSVCSTLYGATTQDVSALGQGAKPWRIVHSTERKKEWLHEVYLQQPQQVIPYEIYYPFPASEKLFREETLDKWSFYENADQNRFLITKHDQKVEDYLHVVYPWEDFSSQEGLWETIAEAYHKLSDQTGAETYIWMDITQEQVAQLPPGHSFKLPSPWLLYGMDKQTYQQRKIDQ